MLLLISLWTLVSHPEAGTPTGLLHNKMLRRIFVFWEMIIGEWGNNIMIDIYVKWIILAYFKIKTCPQILVKVPRIISKISVRWDSTYSTQPYRHYKASTFVITRKRTPLILEKSCRDNDEPSVCIKNVFLKPPEGLIRIAKRTLLPTLLHKHMSPNYCTIGKASI